jgi:CMP-N-acetylneuraminic acid synthetase
MIENGKKESKTAVLSVIPARSGSKGVAKKNLRPLGGLPLMAHGVRMARKSKMIDRLILSSEDDEILEIGKGLGVEIPFRRPSELASDQASLVEVVLHAYRFFREHGRIYDAVLSLQPTCPFLKSTTIDRVIELWKRTKCDSVTTVAEITKGHPYIAKSVQTNQRIEEFCPIPEGSVVAPRQKRKKAYYLTGGIYLRDRRLLEHGRPQGHFLGDDARAVIVDQTEAMDINSELDFRIAEFLIESGYVEI